MNLLFFTFSSVQSLSRFRLLAIPWIAARQSSLSITNSQSSLRLTSTESVMPSSQLILCRPLLLLPPIPPSIRVFSNESTLRMRWPKYWPILITYLYLFCTFLICLFWYPFWSSSNISSSFLLQELCLCFFFCRQTLDYVKCPMLNVPFLSFKELTNMYFHIPLFNCLIHI